jgi:peptidoglycan-associated lipoprotein
MKKLVLMSTLMLGFIFSGCSSKEDTTANMNVDSVVKKDSRVLVNEDLKNVYFDFDKYDLTSKANDTVTRNAGVTKSITNNGLTVEGHTDEWGSDEYNYALGLKRAEAVKTKLASEGVTDVSTVSYGESNPVCTEKTKECWAENRRAVSIAK